MAKATPEQQLELDSLGLYPGEKRVKPILPPHLDVFSEEPVVVVRQAIRKLEALTVKKTEIYTSEE